MHAFVYVYTFASQSNTIKHNRKHTHKHTTTHNTSLHDTPQRQSHNMSPQRHTKIATLGAHSHVLFSLFIRRIDDVVCDAEFFYGAQPVACHVDVTGEWGAR